MESTNLDKVHELMNTVQTMSTQVDVMVNDLIGDIIIPLDNYLVTVRKCFLDNVEILDDDLNRIALQIPVYLYQLIELTQKLERQKAISKEQASFSKNDALLNSTGTVVEKTAKAENSTANDRLTQLVFSSALSLLQKKIEGAMVILDSVKKVQAQRNKEKALTNMAGSAVGAF